MQRLIGRKSRKFYPVFEVPLGVTLECHGETNGTDGREYPTNIARYVHEWVRTCDNKRIAFYFVACSTVKLPSSY